MKKVLFIVAGGQIKDLSFFKSKLLELNPSGIICADSGAGHLYSLGIIPQAIIGDMDSLMPEMLDYFREQGCKIIRYPEAKDGTDTQLALEYASGMDADEIYLFGAIGTRIDHTLANISLLVHSAKKGMNVRIIDEWCEASIVSRDYVIDGETGQTVSILPFSDVVKGITLDGFEYPLKNGVMEMGIPYGISNRLTAARGVISVSTGYLLVIRYFKVGVLP
jgi:thiamine pyrophosphokinase